MTVIAEFLGPQLNPLEAVNKKDTNWTIGRVKRKNAEIAGGYDAVGVDDTGVGGGVTDGLDDAEIDVEPFNFGASAQEDDKFENLKAEIYWNLREAIRDKKISLPDDKELVNQMCSIRYKFTRKGRIAIESKDDMKKRGLKSPDRADAVAIAYSTGLLKEAPRITVISMDEEDD